MPQGWHGESKRHAEAARRGKRADITKGFARYRIFDPSECQQGSFRTVDVGRKGFSKIVGCRLKGSDTLTTQSILVSHDESPIGKQNFRGQAEELRMRAREKGLKA